MQCLRKVGVHRFLFAAPLQGSCCRDCSLLACTWITRLARSTPTRVISSRDFHFTWLQIDDFEHHQSWLIDAVFPKVRSPVVFVRADSQRLASPDPHVILGLPYPLATRGSTLKVGAQSPAIATHH